MTSTASTSSASTASESASSVAAPVAIFLCAGYGTRMGALTATTPKPLLPLVGRPVLDYLLDSVLGFEGLGPIHVVSNHHYAAAFDAWAEDWNRRLGEGGPTLTVHDDGSTSAADRLGAIGDLAFVLDRIGPVPGALVAAGDNLYRFSLEPLWQAFRARRASQVLALHEPDLGKLRRTGVLELEGRKVVRLHEKPAEPPSEWACPSLYVLNSDALARVPGYLAEDRPKDEIGRLIGDVVERHSVEAVTVHGERLHVGSPESYRHAEEALRRELRTEAPD